ncbi:MAG: hypothetical protein AB1742_03345 [bacterium]
MISAGGSVNEVYIAGAGLVPMKEKGEDSFADSVYNAVTGAIRDSGLTANDIDTVIDAGIDLLDGKGISNTELIAAAGCFLKEEAKVEEDGLTALFYAEKRIKSGKSRNTLVFGYSKCSCVDMEAYSNAAFDPTLYRRLGFTESLCLALQASAAKEKLNIDPDALLGALNDNAGRNPWMVKKERSNEEIISPLRERDLPLYVDGAAALVLTADRETCPRPVRLLSSWTATDSGNLSLRQPDRLASFEVAVAKALQKCGLRTEDVDVWELSEPTPYHLSLMVAGASICRAAELPALVKQGRVNPSGGACASTALVACGLYRTAFGAMYARGEENPFLPGGAKRVCVHGYAGVGMQTNTIAVLEAAQ